MPQELQDRFKSIKAILDICNQFEEEEQNEIRQLDLMYETLYADIYSQRTEVLLNTMSKDHIKDLVAEFDQRVKIHEMDPSFKQFYVPPFEVKDTIKQKKDGGVANFW